MGLTLRITPHVSDGDFVSLDIFQEVSSVVPTADTEILTALGPTTTKRSAETSVVVKDKETVIIGGLIEDRVTRTEEKVPYLGDIPYLGWIFSFDSDRVQKVNLMIMLTPRVIRGPADLARATDDSRMQTEEFFDELDQTNTVEKYLDERRRRDRETGGWPSDDQPEPPALPESVPPLGAPAEGGPLDRTSDAGSPEAALP